MVELILDQDSECSKEEDEPFSSEDEEDPSNYVLLEPRKNEFKDDKNTSFMTLLVLTAALGGFLFGYDTGVVSGAILEIRRTFSLSSTWLELIVSVTIAMAAVSSFLAGFLCDVLGRRPTLLISSILFSVGAAIMALSYYPHVLLVGRATVGIAIGIASTAVPMYIAELAPSEARGKLVLVGIMFLTGGQFIATVVCGLCSYLPNAISWRFMLGLAAAPSLLMYVGFLFMPESPRWLVFHGKSKKARDVLLKIRPQDAVTAELLSITKNYEEDQKSKMGCGDFIRRFCTSRSVLLALMVGCGLLFFQQLSGINTVMYYSASIIQMAGFEDRSAIWLATIPAGGNFLFTIVSLFLVDRIGRRKLLLGSCLGIVFGFVLLSFTFAGMAYYSPPSVPYDSASSGVCVYAHCGSCAGNSGCGFCADLDRMNDSYVHGTCVPLHRLPNGSVVSRFQIGGMICPVTGEQVSKHITPTGSIELDIVFSLSDDKNKEGNSSYTDTLTKYPLERRWFPYSCPGNKFAPLAVLALFIYIAFFASGMGAVPWTVNSEIYPMWARSTAISIATMVCWMSNLAVSMTFLTMADNLGQPITFLLYAGFSVLGLLFVLFFVPETKGLNLEDVEGFFQRPYFREWFHKSRTP